MASADGMRFVIPVSTIHAAYNARYFGRQRDSALYSWIADAHTVFAQTLIPGTQRDSLYALDGLMANQTLIQPRMISTDAAGASEIVFALAWTLGYRWAPRLADLPDQRLWNQPPPLRPTQRARPPPHQHPADQRKPGRNLPTAPPRFRTHRHPLGDRADPATQPQPRRLWPPRRTVRRAPGLCRPPRRR